MSSHVHCCEDVYRPLDVDRLARALGGVSRPMLFAGDKDYQRWRDKTAAAITAAYEADDLADAIFAEYDLPGGE